MANPIPLRRSSAPLVPRIKFADTLTSWLSGMFLSKDKTASVRYVLTQLAPDQLEEAFRGDWIARKIITIPALDATREWRNWQAEQKQIEQIEEVETKFNIQRKMREALVKARLYGGAGIVIGTRNGDPAQEIEPERIGRDGLTFLHVVTRYELSAGPLEDDITSPYFGQPQWYSVNSRSGRNQITPAQRLHPSRLVRFIGNDAPSINTAPEGWGDPVLWVVNDAVRAAGITSQTIAQLIQEAKVDFIKVPDLSNIFSTDEGTNKYVNRMSLINSAKSTTNAVLLDAEEEWDRTQITFTGMPDVLQAYLLIASGAADIPATRLLGQSPAGLQSTGESDIRNYYDRIKSEQSLTLQPAMHLLDQCVQCHALGKVDPDIFYEWTPLWQMNEEQKSKIDKAKAETAKIIVDTGLVPFEALAKGFQNMLIEEGTYPGIEAAIAESAELSEFVNEPLALPKPALQLPKPQPKAAEAKAAEDADWYKNRRKQERGRGPYVRGWEQEAEEEWYQYGRRKRRPQRDVALADRELKPLYVRRDVTNRRELRAWAASQGFADLVPDMHVTLLYSKRPVDWVAMGQSSAEKLIVPPGGPRVIEALGEQGAVVLHFACSELEWRHHDMVTRGASHDYSEYQTHITITYNKGDVDLAKVEPYRGRIILGPEIFEAIKQPYQPPSGDSNGGGGQDHRPFDGNFGSRFERFRTDFNPYHVQSGEHGGEFTTAAGVGGTIEGAKNVRIIPGYGDPIVVHINPSERDLRSLIKDAYDEVVRVILDQKNNLYAWDASQAIHALVWNSLEIDPKDWDQFVLYKGKIAAIGAVEGQGLNWKAPGVAEYIKPDFQRARELLNLAKKHHDAKHYDADIYIDDAGNPDVEYIQNPETGRFEGSRAQAEHAAQQAERARAAQAAAISITAKKKVEWSDFDKAKVHIDSSTAADPVKKAKFLERWNDSIDIAPEEFHKMFDGGVNSNMSIQYNDYTDTLKINSELLNDNGDRRIGECDRTISFGSNRASLDYFVLTSAQQHGGIAKQVLAADNAVYEKLGLDKIDIHANIDVGGYAWAKYGYVPSQSSWHELQNDIMRRLSRDGHGRASRSSGYTPESWEELSNDDQERIESAFQRATYEEFYDSEVENWRESGQALDLAKSDLAEAFMSGDPDKAEWAIAALENVRTKYADQAKPDIPFGNMEVLSAITTSYNSRYGDGRNDVDIDWDDDKLDALVPKGYDPNQLLMSFVEARKPSEYLTEDMRGDIEKALVREFNSKAEDDADDLEPPEYISEGISDYQSDYWSSIRGSERYEWARTHDELPTYDIEEEEEEEAEEPVPDLSDDQRTALLKLVRSSDPKAIWAIADSKRGKELLLNTNWLGALNLRDPEALARFKAYVGKGKPA